MNNIAWIALQDEISQCQKCKGCFSSIPVDFPPGSLYPAPPSQIKVLFIAVAPPKREHHFFNLDHSDNLRDGLLRVLDQVDPPCKSVHQFLERGFFLLHTAKCAIRGTTAPNLDVSRLCASKHLCREIELLLPEALCFLSKNICYPVCRDLMNRWTGKRTVPFGSVMEAPIKGRTIKILNTMWPGRGWQESTETHLRELIKVSPDDFLP